MTFCLLSCTTSPFWKEIYSKRKEFTPNTHFSERTQKQFWQELPPWKFTIPLNLSTLQSSTDTFANSADRYEQSHQDLHHLQSSYWLFDWLFAAMVVSKFRDGRAHFRNSAVKGLNRYGLIYLFWITVIVITSIFIMFFFLLLGQGNCFIYRHF